MEASQESVNIDIKTSKDMISVDGGGAIRILIDGNRLNKFMNEEDIEEGYYDWGKEYSGDDIVADLSEILETTLNLLEEPCLYEEHKVRFSGYTDYLILENLGGDIIRVAYRIQKSQNDKSFEYKADPKCARGFSVDIKNWSNEVYSAAKNLQKDLRRNGEKENAEWINSKSERMKEEIEK